MPIFMYANLDAMEAEWKQDIFLLYGIKILGTIKTKVGTRHVAVLSHLIPLYLVPDILFLI